MFKKIEIDENYYLLGNEFWCFRMSCCRFPGKGCERFRTTLSQRGLVRQLWISRGESRLSEFLKDAIASETLRPSLCNFLCMSEELEEWSVVISSDLSFPTMSTCSTRSSSLVDFLDQHSIAAAMASINANAAAAACLLLGLSHRISGLNRIKCEILTLALTLSLVFRLLW